MFRNEREPPTTFGLYQNRHRLAWRVLDVHDISAFEPSSILLVLSFPSSLNLRILNFSVIVQASHSHNAVKISSCSCVRGRRNSCHTYGLSASFECGFDCGFWEHFGVEWEGDDQSGYVDIHFPKGTMLTSQKKPHKCLQLERRND